MRTLGAALAVLLTPLALTTAAPTNTAGSPASDGRRSAAQDEVFSAMASRSGARAELLEKLDFESFLEEGPGREKRKVEVSSPKGTRVWTASALTDHGLPVAARKAYRRAADLMARTDPGCGLSWTLLAGIGRVESDHGRYGGARLGNDGVSRPRIIGVQLNGAGPVAAIRDTDDGELDRDEVWDRAVGPMQFIPSTWSSAARDGDDDGRRSPHDLDDAAAAAASYLCSGSGSLLDPTARAAAIYRYNQDEYYVALVQAFEVGYRTGVFDIPAPPVEEEPKKRHKKKRRDRDQGTRVRTSDAPGKAKSTTTSKGSKPKPATGSPAKPSPGSGPAPSPTPKPSPSPTPEPDPTEVKALLTECDGGYCLGGKLLDLGVVAALGEKAVGDFDGDGEVGSNGDELAGMLGQEATMVVVALESGKLGIYSINGVPLA